MVFPARVKYSSPPHKRIYAKIDRVRIKNPLLAEIHKGYVIFYRARNRKPPSVSVHIVEFPHDFAEYAERWMP